ncbi:hypothetical protein [Chitinophaga ginsengisoli]|uniref:hypothetical protein n=1 Tax=Chitinophaga ginsengisoli TaxID=363837 RepID=UPI0037433292
MRGLWLKDADFKVGDPIEIVVSKGKLIIKKACDNVSCRLTAANVIAGAVLFGLTCEI